MSQPRVRQIANMPTAMGLATRLAYDRARAAGIALAPLLRQARLTREQIEDGKSRLPVRDQIDFLNAAAAALGDEMLGCHLGLDFELRAGGLIYYVLTSSGTLLELFQRGARFSTVVNEGVIHECIDGRQVGLTLEYTGVPRQDDRHQIEFWLTTLLRLCRRATGVHIRPSRVRLKHQGARGARQLAHFLGCPVEYGAVRDEILFARELRNLAIPHADAFLGRLLVGICEQTLARRKPAKDSVVQRAENVMAPLLPHGDARAAVVARRLGMSPRTFARRLAGEGTTFTQLLHRLRLALSRRYLREGMAVSKVAWLLGYKEVGAFSHAFRRWTGKSPSDWP
jgi:AraC-like DNA-binding protein